MRRKIVGCDMKSFYKPISKIRNVTFIFQKIAKKFKPKKNRKNSYEF